MRLNTYAVPSTLKCSTRTLSASPLYAPSPFPALGWEVCFIPRLDLTVFCDVLQRGREAVMEGGTSLNFRCRTELGSNSSSFHWWHNVSKAFTLSSLQSPPRITPSRYSYCNDSVSWCMQCSLAPCLSHSTDSTDISIRSFQEPTQANLRTTGLSPLCS